MRHRQQFRLLVEFTSGQGWMLGQWLHGEWCDMARRPIDGKVLEVRSRGGVES